ncbi:hypothetical protein TNO006_920003 [Tenacibaculum finnmarkense]|nr:hypothetical protein TNO006_920003 [Tenacibaculum finnmarkense]
MGSSTNNYNDSLKHKKTTPNEWLKIAMKKKIRIYTLLKL